VQPGGGHMRIFTAVLSFILICLCSSVQAVEPIRDHQMMFYYQIPIGADKQQDKKHKFGLRFDQTMHDPRAVVDFSSVMKKPAMLDLQFRHKEALAFKVQGIDYTERLYVQRADAAENVKAPAIDEADIEAGTAGIDTAEEAEAEAAEVVVETAEEGEAEVSDKAEEKKAEKTIVQKKLDELPFGVIIGVLLGIGILAGVGG